MRRRIQQTFFCCLLSALVSCSLFFEPPVVPYIQYPVKGGDTVQSISKRFDVSENEIIQINRLHGARTLYPGLVIDIPFHNQVAAKRATVVSKRTTSLKEVTPDKNSMKTVSISSAKKYIRNLAWPVSGASVGSSFGRRWFSFHEGIDLSASQGAPILAAHDGVVVYSGDGLRGYGNLVVVRGDGILTVYGHNRRNNVRVGERVSKGESIAQVGSTGKSSGPHCHFEVRVKDRDNKNVAVDPLVFYSSAH